jgi:hypothetical protein
MVKTSLFSRILFFALLSTVLVALLPTEGEARTVVRSGDTVSVSEDQRIEGDFYTAGLLINIRGQIEEDLLAAGTEVTINGQVGADVLIVGSQVKVNGTVGDDLRIIGETIEITEPVLGDVFVVGASVRIAPTASITGDVTLIGGTAEISGSVDGRVFGWLESLRVDSAVGGDIDVTVATLTLGEKATVGGDVIYTSASPLIRSQSTTIVGEEVRTEPVLEETSVSVQSLLVPLLMILFSVALWFLLSRRSLQRTVDKALTPGIRTVAIGIIAVMFGPLAIGVLMVSMLGLFAGIAALSLFVLFMTLAVVAVPAVMAQLVYSLLQETAKPISLLTLVVGTAIFGLCLLVPVVGPILLVGFTILNFGALIDLLIRANR